MYDSVVITHQYFFVLLIERRLSIEQSVHNCSISAQPWIDCFRHVIQLVIMGSTCVTFDTAGNLFLAM